MHSNISDGIYVPDSPEDIIMGPRYRVVVKNCECHDQGTVIAAFVKYVGMAPELAYEKMIAVDKLGQTIVAETHQEHAEHLVFMLQHRTPGSRGTGLDTYMEQI